MRFACYALALVAAPAVAQPQPEVKDGKVTIALTLSPEPVKKPLSRFFLTPQYAEQQPGNKIAGFMKSFMEQDNFFRGEAAVRREKWHELPLDELPLDDMKSLVGGLAYRDLKSDKWPGRGGPLPYVDEAARMTSADWQVWFNIRRDGINLLLPEVQKMRALAGVLKHRMRYEVRVGDFEKAAYTARSIYGLAKSFEDHPTYIGLLVGTAIGSVGLNVVEEMVARPGCPNLYWSLMEMPDGVINPRLCLQGERMLTNSMFGAFMGPGRAMSADEIGRETAKIRTALAMMTEEGGNALPYELRYAAAAADPKAVAAARAFLIETGSDEATVKAFLPIHVAIAADVRRYEALLDEAYALQNLPYWEAKPRMAEFEKRLAESKEVLIGKQLLPSVLKVREALARTAQRLAYLRAIEAIRLHAHENGGALPAKLADIKVAVPADPVTGKPFDYSVKDGVATLSGGMYLDKAPVANRHYELRIRK